MGTVLSGIKVTLYDVFGYLLPGLVLLAGLATVFWAFYAPPDDRSLAMPELSVQTWSLLLVAAYFLGHMAQAFGNVIEHIIETCTQSFEMSMRDKMPEDLRRKVESKAGKMFDKPSYYDDHYRRCEDRKVKDDRAKWLYSICDETLAQRGQVQDREVYIYREGFYRGLAIAFLFLVITFLASAWRMNVPGYGQGTFLNAELGWHEFLIFAGISVAGALLAYARYVRFANYRVSQAFIGFLVLQDDAQTGDENETTRKVDSPLSGNVDEKTTFSKFESFDKTIVVIASKAD